MRRPRFLILSLVVLAIGVTLGATVFRDGVASAAATFNAFILNDASNPIPVAPGFETQVLVDQTFVNDQRLTIDVAAYKTLHFDFTLTNGTCFGSGASLLVVESTRFLFREQITANEACTGGFTGKTIEMPGRSITLIAHVPNAGDTWRVLAFGRAN